MVLCLDNTRDLSFVVFAKDYIVKNLLLCVGLYGFLQDQCDICCYADTVNI